RGGGGPVGSVALARAPGWLDSLSARPADLGSGASERGTGLHRLRRERPGERAVSPDAKRLAAVAPRRDGADTGPSAGPTQGADFGGGSPAQQPHAAGQRGADSRGRPAPH